jgi:hypothetical protein
MFKRMKRYVSGANLAQALDVLLAVQVALWGLRLGGWIVVALAPASPLAAMFERGATLSSPFTTRLLMATLAGFYVWLLIVTHNLAPLTGQDLLGRGLVPPVWVRGLLWRVWQTSDPVPPPARWAQRLWLALWGGLGGALLLECVRKLGSVSAPMHGRADGVTLVAVQALLALLAARAGGLVVRDVQRRQDEQWVDRERRAAVPRPSAEGLR